MTRDIRSVNLESIPGTVVLTDAGGVIEYANQQCTETTGFKRSEMVGTPLTDLWETPFESLSDILQHLERQPVWRNVIQHKRKDGTHFKEVGAISKLRFDNEEKFYLLKVGQPVEPLTLQGDRAPDLEPAAFYKNDDSGQVRDDDRSILDTVPYAIAINRMSDQRYLFFNRAFCDFTGYRSEEINGKTSRELKLFHDPSDWEHMREIISDQGRLDGFEVTFRRKDYRLAHALIFVRPVYFSGELCMLYISQDIEGADTAREALRQSVENYRTIIEGAPVSISITRIADSRYMEINDSFCRRTGYRREEVLGRTPPDLNVYSNLEDRGRFLELFRKQGYVDDLEIRFQNRYGKTIESLVSARRLRYKGEDCLLYISTRIDTLKAAQKALAEREENYRTILDLAPYIISITSYTDGTYVQINKAFTVRTGYTPEEVLGRTTFDLNIYSDPSDRNRLLQVLERDGRVDSMEIPFRNKDGKIITNLISMSPIHFQGEDCIISMAVEISELKAAQRALKESETRFRTVFETAADPIFLNDMETGRFIDVNHAAGHHLGYDKSELLKMSLHEIHPSETMDSLSRFSGNPSETKAAYFETQHLRKNGSKAIVDVSSQQMIHRGRSVLLSIVRDVTERKQAENELSRYRMSLEQMVAERTRELKVAQKELLKKEKLAVLGQLTATVSHELRNPLGVIRSSNFFLHRRVQCKDDKIEKHFKRIDEQISRCDAIVADLLEYTRGRDVSTAYQDFAGWLAEVIDVQREQNDLHLNLQIDPNLPKISYDQEKIRRVVINLISNAEIAVTTRAEESEKLGIAYRPMVDIKARLKDDRLAVTVKDNGIGMDEKTLSRAFEPLFTTRARGTGIGLAIVKKIIEEHGGSVTLESRQGEGTRIGFTLPCKASSSRAGKA